MKNYNDVYDIKEKMARMIDEAYSKGYDAGLSDKINVGDEVLVDERRMIVMGIDGGGWKQLWCPDTGRVYSNIITSEMKKTGKHVDLGGILA